MKILVTGFEPFGGDSYNPSMAVLSCLPEEIHGVTIMTAVLPVERYTSLAKMEKLIETEHPDAILSLGAAYGRSTLSVERTAVNMDDYRIADNAGNRPHDERIIPGGPDAYFTRLPYREMIAAMSENGVPASLSESAGTFVCNHVFYGTRYYCEKNRLKTVSGFMHVPCTAEEGREDIPSLPLNTIAKGVISALEALIRCLS